MCLQHYGLDPLHHYISPGLASDAALKISKVKLELLHDRDMLLMFVKATRGGVSQISHRHGKANHKHMSYYDTTQPTKYLTYLDANNLYWRAMSELLPTHKLKWREPEDVENFYNGKMIMIWDV